MKTNKPYFIEEAYREDLRNSTPEAQQWPMYSPEGRARALRRKGLPLLPLEKLL